MSSIGKSVAELSELMKIHCVHDERSSGSRRLPMNDQLVTSSCNDHDRQNLDSISGTYINNGLAGNQGNMRIFDFNQNRSTVIQRGPLSHRPLEIPSVPNTNFTYPNSYRNDAHTNFRPMTNETQSTINGFGFNVNSVMRQLNPSSNVDVATINGNCFNFRPTSPFVIETNRQQQSQPRQENRQPTYPTYRCILPKPAPQPNPVPNPVPNPALNPVPHPAPNPVPNPTGMTHELPLIQPVQVSTARPRGMPSPFERCLNNCCVLFSIPDIQDIRSHFWSMPSVKMQRRYLANLIVPEVSVIGQTRMRFTYYLEVNGARCITCRKHFVHCFGISDSFLAKFLRSTFNQAYLSLQNKRMAFINNSRSLDNF